MSNSVNTQQMRYHLMLMLAVVCAITRVSSNAQESSPPAQTPLSVPEVTAAPVATAQPHPTWFSPDKKWEYKCAEYGAGACVPHVLKAGATEVVLDLDSQLGVNGPDSQQAEIVWAPDSKRFAFNYSPPHAHHTTFVTVAFYQLHNDKWVALHSPGDEVSERSQLVQPLKKHLPKGFNPSHCAPNSDILKLRNWIDANTAILYAPCYGRTSGQLHAAFLFTLKFDEAGNWKIVKTHQLSKKELEEGQ